MKRLNYLQPIYVDYNENLIEEIAGYVMPFDNLQEFNLHYGKPEENAPTRPLLDTFRLLLPQIRAINRLMVDGQPNPAAFLAYEPVPPEFMALIFKIWVEVCYPQSEHEALLPLCSVDQFHWTDATPKHLEYWAPSWAIALKLYQHEYQLGGDSFKFLFGPGRSANTVELVSWPPFSHPRGYRTSIALTISTQSDIDPKKINLHFGMKRWVVKGGNNSEVRLQKRTTLCYVRRLRPWSGDYSLLEPNAFTVLAANYRKEGDILIPQWKSQPASRIRERLSVNIPDITDVLTNPSHFLESDQMDILIPARSYQKAGWGTGVPFSDKRDLLEQIIDVLPVKALLTEPWKKFPVVGALNKSIKQRFQKTPHISKPSKGKLPEIDKELQGFLSKRAKNIAILVCCRTEEVQEALARVAQHYFGHSLILKFQSSQSLADPLLARESKRDGKKQVPDTRHIRKFGKINEPKVPTPIIVEILSKNHPNYRNAIDPYPHIKSILPEYNLIPQCIVSSENLENDELEEVESDEGQPKNLDYRALAAIIDAILPFNQDYPLSSIDEGKLCKDNTVYAGFYVIRRNKRTAKQSFSEPVLVAIYQNEVNVLLPAIDLQFRAMADAICELAVQRTSKVDFDRVISNMLSAIIQTYSSAKDVYLFVHGQNARSYWKWLQDSKFDPKKPPSNKIHIIRIRDGMNFEVPQAYGLSTEQETFGEGDASFGQGIFIPADCDLEQVLFSQTVLSVAKKSDMNRVSKHMSRFQSRTPAWKEPQPRAHNILATPSPEQFKLHHAITHDLRARHWWTSDECEYPVPLSLAAKLKKWCFNNFESEDPD
ncbi:MAG: DUF3893 domain-containing protein [Hormoscilla sp. GUM202]|nr:DUF3893 domain-containing protein [Hormoscilla sp. GUM202]